MKVESFASRGDERGVKDENVPVDRTPRHDEDERAIHGVVPPVPPQAEGVGCEGHASAIEIVDGKGYVRGHLHKTENHQYDREVMMCREIFALPVEMEENKNGANGRGNR